mmetsp:Transcript_27478/g.53921  ORF Transcript_27478/g.53921 Transcript_27478/m.53921 type:complete len:135 (+) Transcript_27478:576-980(+)
MRFSLSYLLLQSIWLLCSLQGVGVDTIISRWLFSIQKEDWLLGWSRALPKEEGAEGGSEGSFWFGGCFILRLSHCLYKAPLERWEERGGSRHYKRLDEKRTRKKEKGKSHRRERHAVHCRDAGKKRGRSSQSPP